MYSEKFLIDSNEVDPFLDLSIPGLFRLLQAIAGTGAEAIGTGKEETTDKGFMWVLTRMDVEISKMPRYMEEIELTTYPGEQVGCFYFRHFFAKNKSGEILLRVASTWALLQASTRKVVMRCPFPHPLTPEKADGELGRPEKLQASENMMEVEKRKITYSMCDLNGHLNNTRYLELIVDAKNRAFYEKHTPVSIVLNFVKEIQEGEEVSLCLSSQEENPYMLVGKVNGEERFLARLQFREKNQDER